MSKLSVVPLCQTLVLLASLTSLTLHIQRCKFWQDKYVLNVLVNEKLDTMERKNWEDILLSKSGYFTACWDERSYASMTTNRMSTVYPINLQVIGPSGDFSHLDYATPLDKVIDALPSLNSCFTIPELYFWWNWTSFFNFTLVKEVN